MMVVMMLRLGSGHRDCERTCNRCDRDEGSRCLLHILGSPGMTPSGAGFVDGSHSLELPLR
jgi:hypothetical protein